MPSSQIVNQRQYCGEKKIPYASDMKPLHYTFIGLGLIGGSVAKALRKYRPDSVICAYMPNKASLLIAKDDGVINQILDSVDENLKDPDTLDALKNTDIFFLCAPVESNISYLRAIMPYLKKSAIITDVGSTKVAIHKAAADLGLNSCFIGGHPMAGSEKTGYTSSDPLIIENAYYMLTCTKEISREKYRTLADVIQSIKSIPFEIDFEKHDLSVAAVSHLPHIIASALVNLVKQEDDHDLLKQIAAGGFKDITRIASSSPIMWNQICESNKPAILNLLRQYIALLENIHTDLTENVPDAIHDLFVSSREYRNSISDVPFGLIQSNFSFSIRVADKPGAISIVSAILAANSVSIKNIGINHNRELGEGALHISFYDSNSCDLAKKVLLGYNYELA